MCIAPNAKCHRVLALALCLVVVAITMCINRMLVNFDDILVQGELLTMIISCLCSNGRAESCAGWQVKKLTEKVERSKRDVESTTSVYVTSLNELNSYNAKYMEDMNEVFSRTQQFEAKRLMFFKKVLYDYHACVDASQITQYVSSVIITTLFHVCCQPTIHCDKNDSVNSVGVV